MEVKFEVYKNEFSILVPRHKITHLKSIFELRLYNIQIHNYYFFHKFTTINYSKNSQLLIISQIPNF